jgi:hypothetical protein
MSNSPQPTNSIMSSPKPVSKFIKFLWNCAGADVDLLENHCPPSDHAKYSGLGGIVLATGLLASLSGGYAFYTIFSTKGDALGNDTIDIPTVFLSIIAGIIWGLIIFNLDRFIISSTGHGNGKDNITKEEWIGAIPRIIMALIIGITMSAPLEVRILQSEINAELQTKQDEKLIAYNLKTDSIYSNLSKNAIINLSKTEKEISDKTDYFEKRRAELVEQMKQLDLEAAGKTANGVKGMGPAYRSKKENLDKLEAERKLAEDKYAPEEARLRKLAENYRSEIITNDLERTQKKIENKKKANALDGLLERIHISHEIGGWVPWMIMFLLLAIETGPVIFKLMMIAGPYDYLSENKKKLILARSGIIELPPHTKDDKAVVEYKYFQVEKMGELAEKANTVWGEEVSIDLEKNPSKYIK